jgi:hypothetical protein
MKIGSACELRVLGAMQFVPDDGEKEVQVQQPLDLVQVYLGWSRRQLLARHKVNGIERRLSRTTSGIDSIMSGNISQAPPISGTPRRDKLLTSLLRHAKRSASHPPVG